MTEAIQWQIRPEARLVFEDYVRATIAMRRFVERYGAFLDRETKDHCWTFKPNNPRWQVEPLVFAWSDSPNRHDSQGLRHGEIAPGACHTNGHTTWASLVHRLLTEINWALDNQLVISPARIPV